MNAHEEFWSRVNAALDERRDPLEDARVQQMIEREPKLLGELATLRTLIAGAGAPLRRRAASAVGWFALAAGLAAIVFAARWNAPRSLGIASSRSPQTHAFRAEPVLALLELRATFTQRSASGTHTTVVDLRSGERRTRLERVHSEPLSPWIAVAAPREDR